LTLLPFLLVAALAAERGDPLAVLPRLAEYAEPDAPDALWAWASPGETLTAWVGGDDGCRPLRLERTERGLEGRTEACMVQSGAGELPLACELVLGAQARTGACTLGGEPAQPHAGLALALVMADEGAAWFAPAVQLMVECPRIERLERCRDGTGRSCSYSPGCQLIELGADRDEEARQAQVGGGLPVDCSRPCPDGIPDPDGTAAWLEELVAQRPAVPLDPSRGYALYRSEERCAAESGWGSSLLELPSCDRDRLAAAAERALDRCVRPRKKERGLPLELRLLVGPSGKLIAADISAESYRAEAWASCVHDELRELELGPSAQGQAWSHITQRVLVDPG
jgi:hypothetical protein